MTQSKDTTEYLERGLTLYKCQGGPYELQNALTGELTEEYECYLRSDVDKVVHEIADKANQYKTLFNEKCRDINTQERLFAEQIAQLRKENELLKDELLDAKRDACRFEKAMYRATFNWAHARSFIYMKGISSEIPPQWRRVLDLCKLGYDFAEIKQDKLPKKPKTEQETTGV